MASDRVIFASPIIKCEYMADDYLGRKMEDHASRTAVKRRPAATLCGLLARSRACFDYDPSFDVRDDQLGGIAGVNESIPSAARLFRFRTVRGAEARRVLEFACCDVEFSTPPDALIVVCTVVPESRTVDIELGVAVQSMSLRAAEMGLATLRIDDFDRAAVAACLDSDCEPLAILAVGRSAARASTASNK